MNKRQKEGQFIIAMTDKLEKLAVVEMELYMKMAESHTCHDVEVGPEEIHRTQRVINGHVSEWIKMMGMGEKWKGHIKHQRETHIDHGESVAPLYLLVKDHKPYDPEVQLPPS